jgi:hypothetical protein
MIAEDFDIERARRDPAYVRSILERIGLRDLPAERQAEGAAAVVPANAAETPYAR